MEKLIEQLDMMYQDAIAAFPEHASGVTLKIYYEPEEGFRLWINVFNVQEGEYMSVFATEPSSTVAQAIPKVRAALAAYVPKSQRPHVPRGPKPKKTPVAKNSRPISVEDRIAARSLAVDFEILSDIFTKNGALLGYGELRGFISDEFDFSHKMSRMSINHWKKHGLLAREDGRDRDPRLKYLIGKLPS